MSLSPFVGLSSHFTSADIGQDVTFGGGTVQSLLGGSAQPGVNLFSLSVFLVRVL